MSELMRGSPYVSNTPSPYPSHPPSDSPSPSSSFRGDRTLLLTRNHVVPFVLVSGRPRSGHCHGSKHIIRARSSSLDDVSVFRRASGSKHHRSASARNSRKRKNSELYDRKQSRRASACTGLERSRSGSMRSRRTSTTQTPIPSAYATDAFDNDFLDEEELKKNRRHRIAFWMVLGSFIFIALSSILVVVVTLTHQSEYNTTVTYYTFAKPSSMILKEHMSAQGE